MRRDGAVMADLWLNPVGGVVTLIYQTITNERDAQQDLLLHIQRVPNVGRNVDVPGLPRIPAKHTARGG